MTNVYIIQGFVSDLNYSVSGGSRENLPWAPGSVACVCRLDLPSRSSSSSV